jgi:hypothetical protein
MSDDATMPEPTATATAGAELTAREQAILEFEATWWTFDEARDTVLRARFQCAPDDYYQELNQLLDHPGALAFDPLVVRRLRRQRERRRRARIDGPANVGGTSSGTQGGNA